MSFLSTHVNTQAQLSAYLDSIQALLETGHFDQAELLFEKFQQEFAGAAGDSVALLFEATRMLLALCKSQRRLIHRWNTALEEAAAEEKELEDRFLNYWSRLVESTQNLRILVVQEGGLPERMAAAVAESSTNIPIEYTNGDRQPHWRRLLQAIIGTAAQQEPPPPFEPPLVQTVSPPIPPIHEKCELVVYALGPFRVFVNGRLVDKWWGNKGRLLLKYFVAFRDRPIHRDLLMDTFWGDDDPEAARRNLHQAIYSLRRSLQIDEAMPPLIVYEDQMYLINSQIEVWSDFESFFDLYYRAKQFEKQGQRQFAVASYEAAATLYGGDFMAEDIYEAWPFLLRENLKLAFLDLLDQVSQHYLSLKNYPLAILYCRRILEEDNCREDIHRRLMRAYMSQGQRHLALNQYYRCEEALLEELSVEPMPATIDLFHDIQHNPLNFLPD